MLEDGFFHGLGHGVGLEVHELPNMGRTGQDLVPGDVITIEPGLYRSGYGGLRLEDLVLVTEDGYEVHHGLPVRPDAVTNTIDTMLLEERRYAPDPEFARQANAQPDIYERDWEELWETEGRNRVTWFEPFSKLYEWEPPYAKWYLGGKLNVCFNCVDRHVEAGNGDKVAYYWEGEPEDERRTITFADLQRDVVRFANALKELGVKKGTPVGIYMGMVPELPVAMLACARLGAPHTVVFGGFSAESLSDRLNDMECELLITQDEGWRARQEGAAEEERRRGRRAVSVASRTCRRAAPHRRRRRRSTSHATSGGTSSPRARTTIPPRARPSRWTPRTCSTCCTRPERPRSRRASCTRPPATSSASRRRTTTSSTSSRTRSTGAAADVGWVTGHSYIVYGPLANGTTGVLYEGVPNYPNPERWWEIIERYKVDILYTAPTAIRSHMKWGPEHAQKHDLSSLRLLGTVGEPINPEAWVWYREHIGGDRTPIVDTWWQTETGMILITPLPGVTTTKPGSATKPFPGVEPAVYSEAGEEVGPGGGGYLVLKRPWPAMLRGIHKDDERYRETYWSKYERRLLRRRRRAHRRGRRLLAARAASTTS